MNTKKVVLEISQRIGIDFAKYQTQEMATKIEVILQSIPKAKATIFLPIFCIVGINFLWIFIKPTHNLASIALFFFMFSVAVVIGGGLGLLFAIKNLRNNLTQALDLAVLTTKEIYHDLLQNISILPVKSDLSPNKQVSVPPAHDILKGVALGIVFPMMKNFAIKKAGFIGKILFWVIEKTFMQVLLLLLKQIENTLTTKINTSKEKLQNHVSKIQVMITVLESSQTKINQYSYTAQKIVFVPLLTVIGLYSVFSVIVITLLIRFM
jgi:hypothetical protein